MTGGYVYRGTAQPEMRALRLRRLLLRDILTLQVDEGAIDPKRVLETGLGISSFGSERTARSTWSTSAEAVYRVLVDG